MGKHNQPRYLNHARLGALVGIAGVGSAIVALSLSHPHLGSLGSNDQAEAAPHTTSAPSVVDTPASTTSEDVRNAPATTNAHDVAGDDVQSRDATSQAPVTPPVHMTTNAPTTYNAPAPSPEIDYRTDRTTVANGEAGNVDDLALCANTALEVYADDPITFVRDIALYNCLYFYDPNLYNSILNGS